MQAVCRRDADDGQDHQHLLVYEARSRRDIVRPERDRPVEGPRQPGRMLRTRDVVRAEYEPAFQRQQQQVKSREKPEHRKRRGQVGRDHRVVGTLRVSQVQQQRGRYEQHDAKRCQQSKAGHRFELLHAENMVHAGNGKGAGDEAGQVRIDDDQDTPGDDRFVRIDVACEWSDFSHDTSLSIPT